MESFTRATRWRLGSRAALLLLVAMLFSAMANPQAITLGEAVDNVSLVWTTGGDADWFGQRSVYYYDGDAAQSGDVIHGQSSWIETTVEGPGFLWFYWRVSSPFARTDLVFYVDGVEESDCRTYEEWELEFYSIRPGSHTLRWDYAPFLQHEGDAGFLDRVVFVSGPAIMVEAPNGGEAWYHRDLESITWVSTEDVGPNVKIELYKGGSFSHTISSSTRNDGRYTWFVPPALTPGADYRVKVTATADPSIYDHSDGDFSIEEGMRSAFGGALLVDGVDDYAGAGDHPELDVGDETGESLTVEAWVNFGRFDRASIAKKASAYGLCTTEKVTIPPPTIYYRCLVAEFWYPGGGGRSMDVCHPRRLWPEGLWIPGWHHVAMVFDGTSMQGSLYMDGERVGEHSVDALNNSAEPLKVGASLAGAVDEVRISDIVRYSGPSYEVQTAPFTCDEHTRALWHFDECEGATLFHDACGGVDNLLVGYNGAHAEGVACHRIYLPLMMKNLGGTWTVD